MSIQPLKRLNETHRLIARLHATGTISQHEIAGIAGVNTTYISRLVNDSLFRQEVERIREKLEQHIIEKRDKALNCIYDNLEDIANALVDIALNGKSESARERACIDALSYVLRKKGDEKEKEGEQPYLAAQINDVDDHSDDPDVNPASNKHIEKLIQFPQGG